MNKQDKAEIKDIVTNAVRGIDGRLANLEQNMATKADIADMATKADIADLKRGQRKLRKEIKEGYSRTARVATSSPTLEQFDKLKARVDFRFPVN